MSSLFSTSLVSLLRVSGVAFFFSGSRDSILLIFLGVLHILMNLPVLLRGGVFQVTLKNNVSRFATEVADNILSGFLSKICLRYFFILFSSTLVSVLLLSLIVSHVKLVVIQKIYCRHDVIWVFIFVQWKLGLRSLFKCATLGFGNKPD